MTREKWACIFFGCIAAILLYPLIWPYLEPVLGPKPVDEAIAIENTEVYLTETYPTLTYSIKNCWYNDCCNEFWVDIDPEHSSLLNFRVYSDRKGLVTHDDLKDPFGALQ